jgi:hypothetical protein
VQFHPPGAIRHGDLVKPGAVVRDAAPELTDRTGIALEAVDPTAAKLGEELKRVAAVVASDLEDQRVVTAHELVDLGLREKVLMVLNSQRLRRSARQEGNRARQELLARWKWRDC